MSIENSGKYLVEPQRGDTSEAGFAGFAGFSGIVLLTMRFLRIVKS